MFFNAWLNMTSRQYSFMDFFFDLGFLDLVVGAFAWSARHSALVSVDIIQL